MANLIVAGVFAVALIGLAVWANRRLRREKSLPMQWLPSRSEPLSRSVVWSAPRPVALGLIPLLSILVLGVLVAAPMFLHPAPEKGAAIVGGTALIGCVSIAAQALHLWLVKKTLLGGTL